MPKPTFFNRLQGWLNTWPLPAVLAWASSWGVFKMLAEQGAEPVLAIALATAMGVAFSLADGAQVLDAGCGAGDGLRALRKAYPQAALHGLEYSWPLRWVCALRCPWARVRQGDIWLADWSQYDMVYVFQRPESMPRAVEKGAALRAGAWLVSLDFEAAGLHPQASYQAPGGKMVWLYQAPFVAV